MSAPALVVLGCALESPAAARSAREIVTVTRRLRPDLRLTAAFTSGPEPHLSHAVREFRERGFDEVVVVPLAVSSSEPIDRAVAEATEQASHVSPDVRLRSTGPLGADPSLLHVVDERVRTALRTARVRELDAVVLAAGGSSDPRVTAAITRLARLWSQRHHLPTSVAFAEAAPPSPGEAVRDWRRQGKRSVAVGSLFVTSGPQADRAAELALEAGACAVSAPLGAHELLGRLVLSRYSVGALALVPV